MLSICVLICAAIFPSAEGKLMFSLPAAGSAHGVRFYPSYSDKPIDQDEGDWEND